MKALLTALAIVVLVCFVAAESEARCRGGRFFGRHRSSGCSSGCGGVAASVLGGACAGGVCSIR